MNEALESEPDREALKRRAADFSPERITDQFLRTVYPEREGRQDFKIATAQT